VLLYAVEKYSIPSGIPFENLSPEIMKDVVHQVKSKCKKYVIGAMYEDTK
jgi:hypothetical protein